MSMPLRYSCGHDVDGHPFWQHGAWPIPPQSSGVCPVCAAQPTIEQVKALLIRYLGADSNQDISNMASNIERIYMQSKTIVVYSCGHDIEGKDVACIPATDPYMVHHHVAKCPVCEKRRPSFTVMDTGEVQVPVPLPEVPDWVKEPLPEWALRAAVDTEGRAVEGRSAPPRMAYELLRLRRALAGINKALEQVNL